MCVVAWLLARLHLTPRCDIVFVESAARVNTLSLTGRMLHCMNICSQFIVQWTEVASVYTSFVTIPFLFGTLDQADRNAA